MRSLQFIPNLYKKGLGGFLLRIVPLNNILAWLYFDDFGSLNEDDVIAEFPASLECCQPEYLFLAECCLNSLDVFCKHLPSMRSLQFIDLTQNPNLYKKGLGGFLLRLVPLNNVIAWLYFDDFGSLNEDDSWNKTIHHLDINNAGY